ncbi:hypothetical protein [Arenibaculum pallidiluteum]|uniref:hypothetical protein n=1 Tax=Arenibaculum pallidiluteum TaxID=2812559 RepID=UPI001A960676|nr:hypothetical protein [Arenibaculum pallidiluteum]
MEAVILCGVPAAEAGIQKMILDCVTLLETEGAGTLGFVGRGPDGDAGGRTIIAVRLASVGRAETLMRTWRRERGFPPTVELTLLRVEGAGHHGGLAAMFP